MGVVPDCKDKNLMISRKRKDYYEYLRKCRTYGDSIAQHGYEHKYDSISRGIYGNTKNSEFAGHVYKKQLEKKNGARKVFLLVLCVSRMVSALECDGYYTRRVLPIDFTKAKKNRNGTRRMNFFDNVM